ncbi:MAG: 23S rRNA (adenine(2503)-C(2))-methyltransferase RlmN [Acidobacteriota bacterium]
MNRQTQPVREGSNLLDLNPESLGGWIAAAGESSFRAEEILRWAFGRRARRFEEMTSLPSELRRRLGDSFQLRSSTLEACSEAADGTVKVLLKWRDGATTESVMIPAPGGSTRRTVCLSTQVGCDVGCRFCASGIGGSLRDLSIGEILEQAFVIGEILAERDERLSHVVFMGMGEPLANYTATVGAIRSLNAPWGLGIGQRRITVSTVGLPKQIERLATEGLQITLALSLHAPNDILRRELIPWAEGISLNRLLAACRSYLHRTGREITIEYCLLAGINDDEEHAVQLAGFARQVRSHVNLLMYNPVEGLPYARPSRNRAIRFLKSLRSSGIGAHLRESRGLENTAACGQLRRVASSVQS